MVESTRLKLQSISERLHSIPNNESFKFNNHSAIFLKGKSLTEADRDIIDSTISEITARTYPKVSISIQKLKKSCENAKKIWEIQQAVAYEVK